MSRTRRSFPNRWKPRISSFDLTWSGIAEAAGYPYVVTYDPRNVYVTARDRKSKKSSRNTVRLKRENNRRERCRGRILPSKEIW